MFPILNPTPISLPVPSLWAIPVHEPQASCILHQTWTGDLFHIWYYTCFNAILPNHPTLALSQSPKDCSIYLCLFCCLTYRVIVTIFLIPYICVAAAAAKWLQSCLTRRDPIDGSPPGSVVPGILQARTLEWVAISFSTMEYYSAIKKNAFESVLMRWMKLEPILQSEVSQKEKHQYSILTCIYGI